MSPAGTRAANSRARSSRNRPGVSVKVKIASQPAWSLLGAARAAVAPAPIMAAAQNVAARNDLILIPYLPCGDRRCVTLDADLLNKLQLSQAQNHRACGPTS